ncbi:MAG: class I SAM-dependent methyltransferase [Candidatus Edwardsbacteria bacterium]
MQNPKSRITYVEVTETPDTKGSEEQLIRLYTRYKFASELCKDKDVLEVACGAGQGLGYLAKYARSVVGGDIDEKNLDFVHKIYKSRNSIKILYLNAHNLPFPDKNFDVVILYEAIYYLQYPDRFIKEAKRVLRNGGVLIIGTVNKDWDGFNPSPFSYKYFSAPELCNLLKDNSFTDIKLYGDCPVVEKTLKDKIISFIKQFAVRFHLIPRTMKGKELFKRIFFGKLIPMPAVIEDGTVEYYSPPPISGDFPNLRYKVMLAVGCVKK